jgi:hypothetical protein
MHSQWKMQSVNAGVCVRCCAALIHLAGVLGKLMESPVITSIKNTVCLVLSTVIKIYKAARMKRANRGEYKAMFIFSHFPPLHYTWFIQSLAVEILHYRLRNTKNGYFMTSFCMSNDDLEENWWIAIVSFTNLHKGWWK